MEQCYYNPCPPLDKKACVQNGGVVTATDNGCCMKCQTNNCDGCKTKISTSPESLIIDDECVSVVPIVFSYCDGFCRGSYHWMVSGSVRQWSCCKPKIKLIQSVILKCFNGSEIAYRYEKILTCECSSVCQKEVIRNPVTKTLTFN